MSTFCHLVMPSATLNRWVVSLYVFVLYNFNVSIWLNQAKYLFFIKRVLAQQNILCRARPTKVQ